MELADTLDLGSSAERCAGSSPAVRTIYFEPIMKKELLKKLSVKYRPKVGDLVNVFDDGKIGRAVKAKILKIGSNCILIEILDKDMPYAWNAESPSIMWYKRVRRENDGAYCSLKENYWFYPYRQSKTFAEECKEYLTTEYWNMYFQHIVEGILCVSK